MIYKQLTQEERYQIYLLIKAGHNQTDIAMILNRHRSTINCEIQSNMGLRGYCPYQVQRLIQERRLTIAQLHICELPTFFR